MRWRFVMLPCLAAIMVLSAPPARALPRLGDLVRPGENLAALLPDHETWSGVYYCRKKKLDAALTAEIAVDSKTGEATIVSSSPFYHLKAVLDRTLLLKESTYTTTDKYTNEKLGHDRREARRADNRDDRLSIVYSKNGKVTKETTVRSPFFTIHLDVFQATLQALLVKGVGDFTTGIILGDRAWKAPAEFRRVTSRNFPALSPQFAFPKQFGRLATLSKDHIVYVMQLASVYHLLYPHKFYCAFEGEPPHRFVAYWGGEPGWVEFAVRRDLVDDQEER